MKACIDWLMNRRARHLTDRLADWIPRGSRIADIGSGTGHNARDWTARLNASVDEFDVADLHWVGPGPIIFDGHTIPVADAGYPVVTVLFVLQYVPDPEQLLREARRISSGRVIVIQSTYRGMWGRLWLNMRGFAWGPLAYSIARLAGMLRGQSCPLMSRTLFSRHELKNLFQQSGLTIRHWDTREWWGLSISRDLYVLDIQPDIQTSPSLSPLVTRDVG